MPQTPSPSPSIERCCRLSISRVVRIDASARAIALPARFSRPKAAGGAPAAAHSIRADSIPRLARFGASRRTLGGREAELRWRRYCSNAVKLETDPPARSARSVGGRMPAPRRAQPPRTASSRSRIVRAGHGAVGWSSSRSRRSPNRHQLAGSPQADRKGRTRLAPYVKMTTSRRCHTLLHALEPPRTCRRQRHRIAETTLRSEAAGNHQLPRLVGDDLRLLGSSRTVSTDTSDRVFKSGIVVGHSRQQVETPAGRGPPQP